MDKEWRPGERKAETPEKKPTHKPVEEWNEPTKRTLPSWWWVPVAALVLIAIIIAILPDKESVAETTESQPEPQAEALATVQAQLTSCQEALAAQPAPTEACSETAFRVLRADLAQCTRDLELTKDAIDETEEHAESLEATVADAARRICCAQRVENNAINSYDIDDNKIVCTANGDTPISC